MAHIDNPDGYGLTGRHPHVLVDLIRRYGDDIWQAGADGGDRGDRYSQERLPTHSRLPKQEDHRP